MKGVSFLCKHYHKQSITPLKLRKEEERKMEKNFSKIDKFNATVNSTKPENVLSKPFIITGVYQYVDDVTNTETGEIEKKTITVIKTQDNDFIGSPSETLRNSVETALSIFEDEIIGMSATIESQKSNSGRSFYVLKLQG